MSSPSTRERLGLLLGFVGMAIFGGTLPATRIAVAEIDPIALTALRTAIAGLCSLALLLVLRRPLPTLWASVRGWTKDQRRGVFQIFNGTVLGAALILQAATGFVKLNVFWFALLAMPGTLIGARLGMRTYHALNDRNFYDVVLALLFLSGLGLVWSSIAPR